MSVTCSLTISIESSALADEKQEPRCFPTAFVVVLGGLPQLLLLPAGATAATAAPQATGMHVGERWNFNLRNEIFSQSTPNYTELFNIYNSEGKINCICDLL